MALVFVCFNLKLKTPFNVDYVFSVILGCLEVRMVTASTLILFSDANRGSMIVSLFLKLS